MESQFISYTVTKHILAMQDFGTFDCKNLGFFYVILPIDIDASHRCYAQAKVGNNKSQKIALSRSKKKIP